MHKYVSNYFLEKKMFFMIGHKDLFLIFIIIITIYTIKFEF